MTVHLADYSDYENYQRYGLIVGDSTPTAWFAFFRMSHNSITNAVSAEKWTNASTRSTVSQPGQRFRAHYLRVTVNSGTSMDCYISDNGLSWVETHTAVNPGLGSVAYWGVAVCPGNTTATLDMWVDWVRFS